MTRSDPEHELDERRALAERVRQALIATARAAHEDAGMRGLCPEGAWEAVVTALRGFDLAGIVAESSDTKGEGRS